MCVCVFCLFVCLFVCCLFVSLFVCLFVCLITVYMMIFLALGYRHYRSKWNQNFTAPEADLCCAMAAAQEVHRSRIYVLTGRAESGFWFKHHAFER